ncbi:MAG: hypothetical protein P1Q69_08885 [Candidatus Thorarchaeota archaeon]|nr:hypothetical protein [Candidatus Thorarchaeota archaeon]
MRKISLLAIFAITALFASSICIQPMTITSAMGITEAPINPHTFAGFDSDNITIVLQTPANQSTVEGTFNLTLDITSVNGPLNLTLFVDGEIYPDYNITSIGTGLQNVTVDTMTLPEGLLNFTLLFEDNTTRTNDKESYSLLFTVDNHGMPQVEILGPEAGGTFTGLDDLYLNITSDYSEVYLNVTIDGEMTSEFNHTLEPTGAANYTINGSRYENGHHDIKVFVYTEEGLQATDEITLYFLDYVRFWIGGITEYDHVAGDAEFQITVESPYDSVELSVYVDDVLASDVSNITINEGRSTFNIDTTGYSEGDHNFTFKAYDAFGHFWMSEWELVVDNHGAPSVEFVSPTEDLVGGYVAFTIDIDSTWDTVTVTVYVDDDDNGTVYTDVTPGEFTFNIDTAIYDKWEHTIRVVVETDEGESVEIEEVYGFANMRLNEIVSLALLIGAALLIPLYRKKNGEPIKPAIILDLVYVAVLIAGYVILGVNSISSAIWHINLASIWILGGVLVFMNWVLPLLKEDYEN